jgi:hypothetical protein
MSLHLEICDSTAEWLVRIRARYYSEAVIFLYWVETLRSETEAK